VDAHGTTQKANRASLSDSEIQKAVQAALGADPRVSAFSPDVAVADGIVTLSGTVSNIKAETSAEQDAKNIVGVHEVSAHLKVRALNGAAYGVNPRRRWIWRINSKLLWLGSVAGQLDH